MKRHLNKRLSEYKIIILDMDGTLYYQIPLRFCMFFELMLYYIFHFSRINELFMLYKFRKSYDKGFIEQENYVIKYWMQEKPLKYISLFRDKKLLRLMGDLQKGGAKIAIYSDYPVKQKIKSFPDFSVKYFFCASDEIIQCLKPDPKGLKNILYKFGEKAENCLFIGDRYEKDGKCAEDAGTDYIILDKIPFMRNISLYRKKKDYF